VLLDLAHESPDRHRGGEGMVRYRVRLAAG